MWDEDFREDILEDSESLQFSGPQSLQRWLTGYIKSVSPQPHVGRQYRGLPPHPRQQGSLTLFHL